MNKLLTLSLFPLLLSIPSANAQSHTGGAGTVAIQIDLIHVKDDQVAVTVTPPADLNGSVSYHFARIIPGTYMISDYGRLVSDIHAFNKDGKLMNIHQDDVNTITIADAKQLGKLTYRVSDTYDNETGSAFTSDNHEIFSPAGINILAGEQFMLNMAAFAGYFNDRQETPYTITILHPAALYGSTAMIDEDTAASTDLFRCARFAEVIDNPVMYARPDTASFTTDGMKVLLGVYSKLDQKHAALMLPSLEKTIRAQKNYLGTLNDTRKYAVLAYFTSMSKEEPKGIGALEHANATAVVFREGMGGRDLVHVVGHEFFHTVTPLKIQSKEIRYFDYEHPKMSQHLWFYEGATEYFATLFQVNQGLISENDFLDIMAKKEESAKDYNDTLSFTRMSKNIVNSDMQKQYPNVYMKGALIAMCLDIILRENSGGQKGMLELTKELAKIYGPDRPFDDDELIPQITKLTCPEAGAFLRDHVQQGKPIDYSKYLQRVGVKSTTVKIPEPIVFVTQGQPYINIDDEKKQIVADMPDTANAFFQNLGVKNGDVLLKMNGQNFDPNDGTASLLMGYNLEEGSDVIMSIIRNSKPMTLKGKVKLNYTDGPGYRFDNKAKEQLKNAWLRG
ncbi:M61 family metallopeptidase [Taibaiella soli]|uniref:Peptidase M61 n=1 Tax=Taibaiella soli TaxID=1649169 RepID=A0A2W2B605_9BACT|nr:peptidase M61 [Taibaiella soli]PZF71639.1 peptidase M61 [Taibaiella soli]